MPLKIVSVGFTGQLLLCIAFSLNMRNGKRELLYVLYIYKNQVNICPCLSAKLILKIL